MDSYSRPLYQESRQPGLSQGTDKGARASNHNHKLAQETLGKEPKPKGEPRVGTLQEKLKLKNVF